MATTTVQGTSANTTGTPQPAQLQKAGMTMKEYEECIGRLARKPGVKGVAVTSGDGKLLYHNNGVGAEILATYIEIIKSIEYLCTVAVRENDPSSRWQYIRFDTDEYEMIVTVDPTHWIFLLAEPQELHSKAVEKEEEALKKLGASL